MGELQGNCVGSQGSSAKIQISLIAEKQSDFVESARFKYLISPWCRAAYILQASSDSTSDLNYTGQPQFCPRPPPCVFHISSCHRAPTGTSPWSSTFSSASVAPPLPVTACGKGVSSASTASASPPAPCNPTNGKRGGKHRVVS